MGEDSLAFPTALARAASILLFGGMLADIFDRRGRFLEPAGDPALRKASNVG
jgi:hypothetical protein